MKRELELKYRAILQKQKQNGTITRTKYNSEIMLIEKIKKQNEIYRR